MKITQHGPYIVGTTHAGKEYRIWTPPGRVWTKEEIAETIRTLRDRSLHHKDA